MGCGKSTIGRTLAKTARRPISGYGYAARTTLRQKSVAEVFTETGEAGFRQYEREVLAGLTSEREAIVATGGGACFFDNMETMNRAGLTVYFKMSPEKLAGHLEHGKAKRPLLRDKNEEELIEFIRENVAKTRKVLHAGEADYRLRRSPGRLHRASHRRIHQNEKRAANLMKNLFYLLILAAATDVPRRVRHFRGDKKLSGTVLSPQTATMSK